MYDPPHPGEILKEIYIEPLIQNKFFTITKIASALGVTRQTLSEITNQKTGISVEMALRLAKSFNTSPEMWLNLQNQYDLWRLRDNNLSNVIVLRKRQAK